MAKINNDQSRRRRLLLGTVVVAVAALAAVLVAVFAAGSSASSRAVVKTAKNKALGKTIIVNRRGMTLYALSVERRGRFICTDAGCLSLWHPLVVPGRTKPTGAPSLGVVKRPDGRIQVSYRGQPLYAFVQDRKPGDIKGNGFKDVGVWHPVAVGAASTSTKPAPTSGGPYGY